MKRGFTLIEMLVVIGIITILIGASIAGYSKMTKTAEQARVQELVANVATGLSAYYQQEGIWPKRLVNGDGRLDDKQALVLAKLNCLSLSTDASNPKNATKLIGLDQFGIVTPWATAAIKRAGKDASLETKVANTSATVKDHILYYAIDIDGNGVIEGDEFKVKLEGVERVRATAAVWCIGKTGGKKGKPWSYAEGRRKGDAYSWAYGQTLEAK